MTSSQPFANDTIISWYRGEFAVANAIIDALCGHLSSLQIDKCEYEGVFGAIHRRRLNWIPVIQMQKYYSIGDVVMELEKVTERRREVTVEGDGGGGGGEVHGVHSPMGEVTDTGNNRYIATIGTPLPRQKV
ncbi:hypothetical protein Tco_1578108 [Tanacetum coccineum]